MIQLPPRPKWPSAIAVAVSASLLGILPPAWLPVLGVLGLRDRWPDGLPAWMKVALPLVGIVIVSAYAISLQWFDRRKYDEVFAAWGALAETHGFRPLPDLICERIDPKIADIVRRAQEEGRFVLEVPEFTDRDSDSSTQGLERTWIAMEETSKGLIRFHSWKIYVHPDLLKKKPA